MIDVSKGGGKQLRTKCQLRRLGDLFDAFVDALPPTVRCKNPQSEWATFFDHSQPSARAKYRIDLENSETGNFLCIAVTDDWHGIASQNGFAVEGHLLGVGDQFSWRRISIGSVEDAKRLAMLS